jgi:hypothetical protein
VLALVLARAPAALATAAPAAAHGSASLRLPGIDVLHRSAVTVPGRTIEVTGTMRPYAANQWVEVQAFLGRHRLKHRLVRVAPSANGRYGSFGFSFRTAGVGNVAVTAHHDATAAIGAFGAERHVHALATNVQLGSTGRFVQLIQQRLAALHVYLPQTGVYDSFTGLALDAYHRLLGQGVAQTLDPRTIAELLDGAGVFKVRFPRQGRHAEGDLTHQVLALVDGSQVKDIFPISSGAPWSPTILGSYQVYQRTPGYLPDGMYYSDFFIRGYAIHGYDPAPDYPASHGCMRLPIQDAVFVYDWLGYGDWVDTYYR